MFCPNTFWLHWPCHCCLFRWGWGFILQESLYLELILLIGLSANSGLEVEVSSDKAPIRFCLWAEQAASAGLVSWPSFLGLAHASVHRGSSASRVGTGLLGITFSGAVSGLLCLVMSGPRWHIRDQGLDQCLLPRTRQILF